MAIDNDRIGPLLHLLGYMNLYVKTNYHYDWKTGFEVVFLVQILSPHISICATHTK